MKSTEIKDIVNSRILKTVKLPIEFENCDNPIIIKLLNSSLEKRHQRKQCAHLRAPCRGNRRVPHPPPAPPLQNRARAANAGGGGGLDAPLRRPLAGG